LTIQPDQVAQALQSLDNMLTWLEAQVA
jgi:hypothetical protein